MSDDFDPNLHPLDSKERHDAYIAWCADRFDEIVRSVGSGDHVPYGLTARAARLCYVISVAPIHLDDDVDKDREAYMGNLAKAFTVAYRSERGFPDVGVRDWIVGRAVLDCFLPVGRFAGSILDAARCSLAAMVLTAAHPLVDLGTVHAPDSWALLLYAFDRLAEINGGGEPLGPWDFAVTLNQPVIDRMNWQKVNNAAAQMGAPPLSPN